MRIIKTYSKIRKLVSRIVPGTCSFLKEPPKMKINVIKEKGRKENYNQYHLINQEWQKKERLLNTEQINNFLEISLRAAACPMPFNMDVWDGLKCPFRCIYCFADAFRASLYTSFFDNSKTMGLRHCNPDYYKQELDKMLILRRTDPHSLTGIKKAFAMEIPVRLGIRFEDFNPMERQKGISLSLLKYLKEIAYPVMINTKSDLVGEDEYIRALTENPAKAAVHITIISGDSELLKKLEPGAPSYERRLQAAKNLTQAGVRVVVRIEPYMFLVNDDLETTEKFIQDIKESGVKNITFDTYSYSANIPGVRQNFINRGIDFDRMFMAESDSQKLGSILLESFMEEFRKHGISCSTFDLGNIPTNDNDICCEVSDWFESGWNYGSIVMAARFISKQKGNPVTWSQFKDWVYEKGGFLTPNLEQEVHQLWNIEGNMAYSLNWIGGMISVGWEKDGLVWSYIPKVDERKELIKSLKVGIKNES